MSPLLKFFKIKTHRVGGLVSVPCFFSLSAHLPLQADLTQGLVAWYPFDGNASDMSGNGNHGTVYGATLGTDRFGEDSKSYNFDGVDDRIELDRGDVIGTGLDLTISVWVNSGAGTSGSIFGEYGKNPSNQYQYTRNYLLISNGAISFDQYGPSGGISEASDHNSISYGIWNHVAFSQNSSNWFISIGGTVVSSGNEVEVYTGSTPETAWIGGRKNEVDNPSGLKSLLSGSVDDIRIYDRALSADEVELLYRAESPNHFVDSAKDLEMIWVEPGTFTMGVRTEGVGRMRPSTMSP